jgi:hypothetical protein
MTKLQDSLFADLMAEPGAEAVASIRQPPRKKRRPRLRTMSATAGALVAALATVLLLSAGDPATPAYAVTVNGDGSVALTVNELVGVDEANQRLAKLGIPVVVARVEASCAATGQIVELPASDESLVENKKTGDGLQGLEWVIHPRQLPEGDTIQVTAQIVNAGTSGRAEIAGGWAVYRGTAPACRRPTSGP